MGYVPRGWLMGHNGQAHGLSKLTTIEDASMLELFRYIIAPSNYSILQIFFWVWLHLNLTVLISVMNFFGLLYKYPDHILLNFNEFWSTMNLVCI
jgi:hypothetical protein